MDNNSTEVRVFFPNNDFSSSYELFLRHLFKDKEIKNITHDDCGKKSPDLIVFTGGEDVDPSTYGEKKGKYTHINKNRDGNEYRFFHSLPYRVPKLGICRGAQFLTVMVGGKLIQHVENHNNSKHPISLSTMDNVEIKIPSDHHQMMYPYDMTTNYEILGHSTFFQSGVYLNGDNENIILPNDFVEPEIIHYPDYNALAIQAHPEWADYNSKDFKILRNLILQRLFKNK